ncbi:N-acetyltransferase [Clostridium tagluense]|uniref:N-acetyltransferase n=1 Tax=Clostridium tagluense TaxID=360422 RepID=UPI001CF43B42|nr:N-acetyltransferase [Clostridium tagluense]MCB2314297.1 N-acetyltransferase [Clostridium tagluense]MCB2319148.1 N-acetyltransferase [Clostridium tagluense]MCB2324040.1 N-acetyltransferase [Clostridium tagluense]MCB2328887.1 N-acetyltransferase [Clostridium tagluense]MCB2333746.1 N-acetyltransferase [Clostridium tagluense]
MIKKFDVSKLDDVMAIWLETNIDAHSFTPKEYWIGNFDVVKQMLPSADIYVYEENNLIKGFIGVLEQNYIAGLFVKKEYQKEWIGQKLIDHCKSRYPYLILDVFTKNKKAVNFYSKNDFTVLDESIHEDTKEMEYTMCFGEK